MITLERTHNLDAVRAIYTDPDVWPWIGDDFAGDVQSFRVNADPRIWYLVVAEGTRLLGLFTLLPESEVCWKAHVVMLPECDGQTNREAARMLAPWLWEHTRCRRLVAEIPRRNPAAVLFARWAGLRKFGVNEKSFLKHGQLWDQVCMGISRPEEGSKCPVP